MSHHVPDRRFARIAEVRMYSFLMAGDLALESFDTLFQRAVSDFRRDPAYSIELAKDGNKLKTRRETKLGKANAKGAAFSEAADV